jgi:hypothetical protein
VIAACGQALTHAMHKIQSSARVGSALPSTMSKQFIGQMSTQTPSPSHFSLSTIIVGISITHPIEACIPFFKSSRNFMKIFKLEQSQIL